MKFLKKLWKDEEGQDLVEYGLLLVLIAIVATLSIGKVGSVVSSMWNNAASTLTTST